MGLRPTGRERWGGRGGRDCPEVGLLARRRERGPRRCGRDGASNATATNGQGFPVAPGDRDAAVIENFGPPRRRGLCGGETVRVLEREPAAGGVKANLGNFN